jgi:isochorismate hydrolase
MYSSSYQPVTAGQITVYCDALLRLPNDQGRRNFYHVAATSYVAAIVAYHNGQAPRLPCTLENVVATALYPDYERILALLQQDRYSADYMGPLSRALQERAEQQLAGVIGHVWAGLTAVAVCPAAAERVRQLVA